jgi:hypothetical protein
VSLAPAQTDTLYIYKGGAVITKHAIADIDSITFSKPKTLPSLNIYTYLQSLGSDYSIIRDSILKYNYKKFDQANSIPIGVLSSGFAIYDSVFIAYNPIFDKAEINSDSKQFTMFLPSNSVINSCFQTLQSTFSKMGKVFAKSDSIIAFKWIKEAMFYEGVITDFAQKDINSVYGRVWRTTIQQLDLNNYINVSNGRIYKTTKVKIPTNLIVSRIKSLVEYWEYQDADKTYPSTDDLYTFKGLTGNPAIFVADATPKPTILPNYTVLQASGIADSNSEFSIEFSPLERYLNAVDGKYHVRVLQVPAGEYSLYLGFRCATHPYVYVSFNGVQIGSEIQAALSVPWNYDRYTETDKELNPLTGIAKWDGLGGLVGVVTVDGDGSASFKIKVKWSRNDPAGTKMMRIYHWALKPTANNY